MANLNKVYKRLNLLENKIMRKTFYLLLLLNFNLSFSQFEIINDNDGYVNVRTSPLKGNNIADKLKNGFVVYSFVSKDNWINIDYKKDSKECKGYIFKDRIKLITDFENIPSKVMTEETATYKSKSVSIEIKTTKFIKENHQLKYLDSGHEILKLIDGLQIFGTDGGIPKSEYQSMEIDINNIKIKIPKIALQNLYEPNLYNTKANYDKKNDILYIQSSNSDGAGGYEIIWIIENKIFKERIEVYEF